MSKQWWSEGIRFECQGSGKCCVSRGDYGYVYVTLKDRRALAKHFGLSTAAFTKKYCEKDEGIWKLRDFTKACVFLKEKMCSVYEARPTQCRTWPFWPENMSAKAWDKEVTSFCPGVNKGKVWSAAEIKKNLNAQERSEEQY
ncbi:MAG: YkgJ family cysteine cluster protein [Bacteriovoracia bacterium]